MSVRVVTVAERRFTGQIVGVGNTIPFEWDGFASSLPHGIRRVLPVAIDGHRAGRPPTTLCALQDRYPLQPIESYVQWKRPDGEPFDPWLRVHQRLGAKLLGIAERSMVIEGSIAEWEGWTGQAFPESGAYVVPRAHLPIEVDRERDLGVYAEPNVWRRHPLERTTVPMS